LLAIVAMELIRVMKIILISPFYLKRTRISCLVVGLSVVGFVFMLSGLDAPEYTRCKHIGVCEFLEIWGDVTISQKSKDMVKAIGKFTYQTLSSKISLARPPFLFPLPIKSLYPRDVTKIGNYILASFDQMLDRCIHPSYNKVLSHPSREEEINLGFNNKESSSPSPGSGFCSQAFLIITTSVIRC